MKKVIKIGFIGAGNICGSRHLPIISQMKEKYQVIGIADPILEKSQALAEKYAIPHYGYFNENKSIAELDWIDEVEALVIATPPKTHESLINQALDLGKHVLSEKPFVIDLKVGQKLINKAQKLNLVLAIDHNFQFSRAFSKLDKMIAKNELGEIKSFYLTQFSNKDRRLPIWGDDLPLGLFYDESPHFFYLLRKYAGENIKINNSTVYKSKLNPHTPQIINANLQASNNLKSKTSEQNSSTPIQIYCNFEASLCEWNFIVCGTKKIVNVDLFRDIIIHLPNDGVHLGKEVFITSFLATFQHWLGFIQNGFLRVMGKLDYGLITVYQKFYAATAEDNLSAIKEISGTSGLAVNQLQADIIEKSTFI